MINILLISLLAYIGCVIGAYLAKATKEEIVLGKKYFKIARKTIPLLLAIVLISTIFTNIIWIAPLLIGLIISKYVKHPYLFFGFALTVTALHSKTLLLITATIIFVYGLVYGSMEKEVLKNIPYFVVPLLLLTTPQFITPNIEIWLGLIAGTLLLQK
tara:strand:- start:9563 stop:10036 length:474 start_codon:yes stop_codon:yes gene_type:complete